MALRKSGFSLAFLGTNGWYATKTGNTTCTLLETPDAFFVLDAGDGLQRLGKEIGNSRKPVFILLSHAHLDHIAGLHILNQFRFPQGVTICAPRIVLQAVKTLVRHPYTVPLPQLKMRAKFRELRAGWSKLGRTRVLALPLDHADPCYGYRIEVPGRVVAYCTDTGPCPNYLRLAKNADVLVTECALIVKKQFNPNWPHLYPELAAKLARDSGARQLFLTHFDAYNHTTLGFRKKAQARARRLFANAQAARDGLKTGF